MTLGEYKEQVSRIPYGKRLPTALYVYREGFTDFSVGLRAVLDQVEERCHISAEFNLIKFKTNELKLSFLSYPEFISAPHPALRHAITFDLVSGKTRHADYADNINPPILHRKETFLPADHPLRPQFEALTRAEEDAGLYENTSTIGFKLNWEKLLQSKGLEIVGHTLARRCTVGGEPDPPTREKAAVVVERHKTALTRYDLSKPVKSLLEYGMLRPGKTIFDYGCGQGSDFRGLQALGYDANGWDPVYRREVKKREADIVNFGYVLNVIEDPAERVETLMDAFRLAKRLLVVSGLINETVDTARARQYGDGVLTRLNTFQKFYEQQELQQYIEDALETTAVPVALGVFYVFRDPTEQQDFLSARSKRIIDWGRISAQLGLGAPQTLWKALYEQHKELLDEFGKMALTFGRMPSRGEFDRMDELPGRFGSAKRALRAFVQGGGAEGIAWDDVRAKFGVGQTRRRRWEVLCEEHQELLDAYWKLALELGRSAEPEEFPEYAELREKIGSGKRALRLFVLRGGGEELRKSAEARRRDLLVYLALANLRRKVPFGHLSQILKWDIRSFFGNYTQALKEGLELLYAAGDPGEIELACEGLKLGWQDGQALYVHGSLLEELPPLLRAYVGCATALFGDVSQADVIKMHKSTGKVTFLVYDDFDGKPLPELHYRIKVNLRTRWVKVFDHRGEGQLLYYKERFVAVTHPRRTEMETFSAKVRRLGIPEEVSVGPNKAGLDKLRLKHGLNADLEVM